MAKALKPGKKVKPKKTCCQSSPRCKRCPVVLKRLSHRGFAVVRDDGRYLVVKKLRKKDLKAARK